MCATTSAHSLVGLNSLLIALLELERSLLIVLLEHERDVLPLPQEADPMLLDVKDQQTAP